MATYNIDNLTFNAVAAPLDDSANMLQVTGSDLLTNDGCTFLLITIPSSVASAVTLVVTSVCTAATPSGLGPITLGNYTYNSFATSTQRDYLLGPFSTMRYNNASGQVGLAFTGTNITGVKAKGIRFCPIS